MSIVWLAVSVTVFAAPNQDGTPAVSVVPQSYYETIEDCDAWRKDRYENDWGVLDPVTGKAVSAYYFDCIPQFSTDTRLGDVPFVIREEK